MAGAATWCRNRHNTRRRCTDADCGICAALRRDQNRNRAKRCEAAAFLERTDADRTAHRTGSGGRHSHYSRCGSLQKLSQEPADRYLPGASDRLGTASDCRDFGGCNDHWMGLSAARLCRCQYHYGLPTGCASDLRLYQRVYLRCAVRFFERHPVQLFSDGTQTVLGCLWQQISHNLCSHVCSGAFDRHTCRKA